MDQEEQEFDVYFQGTKEDLYGFVYPLTGTDHSIFNHLQLKKTAFDSQTKTFQTTYLPKDFENIDRQQQPIIYRSKLLQTNSNYFYSLYDPETRSFLWRKINNFVQMRPVQESTNLTQQLQRVEPTDPSSPFSVPIKQIVKGPVKQNRQFDKEQYLKQLTK